MSTEVQPFSFQAWWLAARPQTLTAAFVPVAVGTACAFRVGGVHAPAALAALFGAFAIQIGTNFANDFYDFEKGADTETRLGPVRAAQTGLLSTRALRGGMWTAFLLAALAGAYLVWVAGPIVLAIGVASILSGIAYTGGPFPLAYNGLGDVFVFTFFGFVAVGGTVYVQVGTVPQIAWWAASGVGAIATAILVVNNVRDIEGDRLVGKRTLIARFGPLFGLVEYALLLIWAFGVPFVLWTVFDLQSWVLLPSLALPMGWAAYANLRRERGAALNPLLGKTAKLLLLYGILLSMGLVWPT